MDKETIRTILRELWKEDDGVYSERRIGYNMALQDVQCRIDTLPIEDLMTRKES